MALVQQATGAPRSTEWRRGAPVGGNSTIRPGTAIATFDANGHYQGHAAIYLGQDEHGVRVIDQWNIRRNGRVWLHHTPSERIIRFKNPNGQLVDQGEYYHVVN